MQNLRCGYWPEKISEILVKKKKKNPKHKSAGIQFDCPTQTQSCKILSTSREELNATAVIKAVCSDASQSPAGFRLETSAMVAGRGLRV